MDHCELKARAKINLTLDVLHKRPDGYHEVEMIMQTIDLSDSVSLEAVPQNIFVTTDHPLLVAGESNIAYKAARLIKEKFDVRTGVRIHITKRIPVAAGLAGGSTDAAAVLLGLNRLWGLGLTLETLAELGGQIGSDVPFCVLGGTALARGRGELLTTLPELPEMWLVLVKPAIEVSTAEVYKNFNQAKVKQRPDTTAVVRAVWDGDAARIRNSLVNVLESVTLSMYPEVSRIKEVMSAVGISSVLMSGSGPTVFGIVENRDVAEGCAKALEQRLPGMFITVTKTSPAGRQESAGRK
ncbi:MAG: 4-(cytidine 5'-diphospho)-2-C-methyl-D-erythritol kinase [Thermincola sp.]|nr:4-(cytidine 5'-diphospho)-2-C-methyl-D-erythritol kinase [Thermincola sp.]MDT3702100.1 4-(cytidine 5'-diphospho)-2-C-methyl-D-erythritol kinase [Thermincola sp.]